VPPTALGGICPECMLKAGLATQTEGPGATGPHGTKVIHPPPSTAEIAALFPQLEILECLGRGGMGVVYKARQPRLNRFVALKILAREKEQDAQFAGRFTREAQALARLNHPNIVTVHDFGEAGGHCYLVMEFMDGLNLRQLLQSRKMPSEQALTIVPKICEALQYAHEQGIVHRDIKPENILLDKSGRVKIADFGIAKMMGDEPGQQTLTGAKDAVGTPHYMAPEQIEKPLTVDHRADIYSLGVVFYEMLTGELPLGKFQPPSAKVQIDVRLDEVVLHALEKEPERRYQQAGQVKTAVETIATTPAGAGPAEQITAAQIEAARNQLKIPGRGLIAAGVLQLLFALGLLIVAMPAITHEGGDPAGYAAVGFGAALLSIAGVIVLLGAARMMKLRNYPFSIAAAIVAAVTGPGAILGLPFGVWALIILFRREMRAAFAANRAPTGPTATLDSEKMNFARAQVKGPAIGLIVTGVLNWVVFTLFLIVSHLKHADAMAPAPVVNTSIALLLVSLLAMALSGFIIYGALKIMRLERWSAGVAGGILAMFVAPSNIIGLPIGIWALVVLNRREVRTAFEANRRADDKTTPPLGENQGRSLRSGMSPLRRGALAGLIVLLITVVLAIGDTLLLPRTYVGTALVRLSGPPAAQAPYYFQTESEVIHSQAVLEPVAAALNLSQRWGLKWNGGRVLSDDDTMALMKRMIEIQPVNGSSVIEIRCYSDSPKEAAEIANKIAETFCARPPEHTGEMIDRALPSWRPFRPNIPLNISIGLVAGLGLGIFAGLVTGLLSFWRRRQLPPPVQKPDRFWRFIVIVFIVVPTLGLLGSLALQNLIKPRKEASPPIESFYIGQTWFPQGDLIEITSVERTGNQMTVKGHYHLVSHDQASLALYINTSTNLPGVHEGPQQTMSIAKGQGDFKLIHPHPVPGLPHLSMYADGESFAALYFGTPAEALEESKAIWITNNSSASTIQFRLVLPKDSTEPADDLPAVSGHEQFQLARQVLLDDTAIAQAGVDYDPFGRRMIEIRFTDTGARKFEAITATNIGRQLAIVFRGRVLSAPVIQSVIPGGECQVNGSMDAGEIDQIVDCLNRTATPTSETWSFSPVQERMLPFDPRPNALFGWLDLDSGAVSTNSMLDWQSRSSYDWIRTHGLDVVTTQSAKQFPTLLGIDMIIAPAPTNGWDMVTPADVIHDWPLLQEEPQQKKVFSAMPGRTDTFIFQTREGGKGVLQILGFADGSHGVKVRYKLVQPTTRDTAIDPNTGLPLPAAVTSTSIDPTTGLPMSSGETGTIDPVTGLPVTPAMLKGATNTVVVAEKWLSLIDRGNYSESWEESSAIFQGAVTAAAWENSMSTFRKPLGNLVSREVKSAQRMTELPGVPDGQYVVMQFATSFANKKNTIETVTFMLEKDGQWKSAGYFIK
jgi:tRNA A-37 threonylcarbamoyl transferase component Bud32